jgi:Carotenoid biosynthesis protein
MPPGESNNNNRHANVVLSALLVLGFAAEIVASAMAMTIPGWLDAVVLGLAVAQALSALSRHLPLQNVLLASAIIAIAGGATDVLNTETNLPFGPVFFGAIGPTYFHVPCVRPLIWLIVIFNSRGVARLILRPWRKTKTYGFRVIGLTTLLAVVFELAFEPYAARLRHFWFWQPTKFPVDWYGATEPVFLGWAIVTVLTLAFVTPLLINKQLSKSRGPDLHPLVSWTGALALFAVVTAINGLWPAAIVDVLAAAVVATFAIRGAKW